MSSSNPTYRSTHIPCPHGSWPVHCALCLKRDGECDWGGCTEPSTHRVEYRDPRGQVVERRPMCEQHSHHVSFGYKVVSEISS